MTREECLAILRAERLRAYNFFYGCGFSDEIVIRERNGKYAVYATDKDASEIDGTAAEYDREEDALEDYLERLRARERLRRAREGNGGAVRTPAFCETIQKESET